MDLSWIEDDKSGQELRNILGIPILLSTGSDPDFSQENNGNEMIELNSSEDEELTKFIFISPEDKKKDVAVNEDEYISIEKLNEISYSTPVKSEDETFNLSTKQLTPSKSDRIGSAIQKRKKIDNNFFCKSVRPKSALPIPTPNTIDFNRERTKFSRSNTDFINVSSRQCLFNTWNSSNKSVHDVTFIISPGKDAGLNGAKEKETHTTSKSDIVSGTGDKLFGTTFTVSVKSENDIDSFDEMSIPGSARSDFNEISLTSRKISLKGNENVNSQETKSNEVHTIGSNASNILLKKLEANIKKLEKEIKNIKEAQQLEENNLKNKRTKSMVDSTRTTYQYTLSSPEKYSSPRKVSAQECTTDKQFIMDNGRKYEQDKWNEPEHAHILYLDEELKSPRTQIKCDLLGRPRFQPIVYARSDRTRNKTSSPRQPIISQPCQPQYVPVTIDQAYMPNIQVSPQYVQQQRVSQHPQVFTPLMEPRRHANYNPTMKQIFNHCQQNVNQYVGKNNIPPIYHDEINSSFYEVPHDSISPNIIYQPPSPKEYNVCYPCMGSLQPVYIPHFNYNISQSTRSPCYRQSNKQNLPLRQPFVPRYKQTPKNLNTNKCSFHPEWNEANIPIPRQRSKSLPNYSPRSIGTANNQRKSRLDQHKKCIAQRKKELFMRQLQDRHLFEEENNYLLQRKSLNNIPNNKRSEKKVDKEINVIKPEKYQLIAHMLISQYKLRTDNILSKNKQMETYDLQNIPEKPHKTTNSTQTDILDIEIPFKTIIPSKYNTNNYKSNLFKFLSISPHLSDLDILETKNSHTPCFSTESTFIIQKHKSEDNFTTIPTLKSRKSSHCTSNIPVAVQSSKNIVANQNIVMNSSSKKKTLNEIGRQKSAIPIKTPIKKSYSIPSLTHNDIEKESLQRASKTSNKVTKLIRRKITKPKEMKNEKDDICVSLSVQTGTSLTDVSSGPQSERFVPVENDSKVGPHK